MSAARTKGVFIHRLLTPESHEIVQGIQARLSNVPTFVPAESPHVTILGGQGTRRLRSGALEAIVHPLPPSAEQILAVGISCLGFLTNNFSVRFALMLESNETLEAENKLFAERNMHIRPERLQITPKPRFIYKPHISIGDVQYGHSTKEALSLAGRLPKLLHVSGLVCEPEVAAPPMPPTPPSRVNYIPPPFEDVRTVPRQPIPSAFLNSLRKPD